VNVGSFWPRDEEKAQKVFTTISTSGTTRKVGYDYGTQNGIDYHSTHTIIVSFLSTRNPKSHVINWISFINA
jgi:hypothetical protein